LWVLVFTDQATLLCVKFRGSERLSQPAAQVCFIVAGATITCVHAQSENRHNAVPSRNATLIFADLKPRIVEHELCMDFIYASEWFAPKLFSEQCMTRGILHQDVNGRELHQRTSILTLPRLDIRMLYDTS
jgi:hypothetical protein